MANLLSDSSKYQQIPGLAEWSIADLPGMVNRDYFTIPRSLVAPHKEGPADIYIHARPDSTTDHIKKAPNVTTEVAELAFCARRVDNSRNSVKFME